MVERCATRTSSFASGHRRPATVCSPAALVSLWRRNRTEASQPPLRDALRPGLMPLGRLPRGLLLLQVPRDEWFLPDFDDGGLPPHGTRGWSGATGFVTRPS